MIATTKQQCFNIMCMQDMPANDQKCYSIDDKEGRTIADGYDLQQVVGRYIEWMEERAREDGEYYRWSEVITIVVTDDEGDETTLTQTVHMDSRIDGYDHGRFDYESTRI